QAPAVGAFARNGGGPVASLDTSLFDECGNPRARFALAEVFGVDSRGLPPTPNAREDLDVNFAKSIGSDYWEKRKNVFEFRQDVSSFLNQGQMATYVGANPVTFKGPAVQVAPRDATTKVLGTIRVKTVEGVPAMPGVVTHAYGKGRVVYLAAGFDAAYYLYAYPYQRLALRHAITWAASGPQPVTVEAPMCVHSTLMQQAKDGERLVLH